MHPGWSDGFGAAHAVEPEQRAAGAFQRSRGRWLKPLVSLCLYALIFYWTDVRAIAGHL